MLKVEIISRGWAQLQRNLLIYIIDFSIKCSEQTTTNIRFDEIYYDALNFQKCIRQQMMKKSATKICTKPSNRNDKIRRFLFYRTNGMRYVMIYLIFKFEFCYTILSISI